MHKYVLKELKNNDGTPLYDGVKSSFACTCNNSDLQVYQKEFVRIWNKFFTNPVQDFKDWSERYDNMLVFQGLLTYIENNFGYNVTITNDQFSVLHFNSYLNNNSFRIQCDEYIYGIVDMFNFLEIYEPALFFEYSENV